ncbi:hypothetical protein HPB51_002300 [Rhipicephalus microplus]|uniref:Uncharacterized protein n=1 Tax=Rhipicephalus microplus TaxID=6941 RepID=A0A9J6DS62_RHIMP|nr:hypothetical protein HPB51_002300 [Rhipicephalus microplus]
MVNQLQIGNCRADQNRTPREYAGSDEEEKLRTKHSTTSTTTRNELARRRARTPRHRKAKEPKALQSHHTKGKVGEGPVTDPDQNPVKKPFEKLLKIQSKLKATTEPRRGRNPCKGELCSHGLWVCCCTYKRRIRLRAGNNTDQTGAIANYAKVEGAKVKNPKHTESTNATPTASVASTRFRASETPVAEPVSGETPPHQRRAKENAEEQSDSTLEKVKETLQETFVGLQHQLMQMRTGPQQQMTQTQVEMPQMFNTLEVRVVQLKTCRKTPGP